MAEAPYTLLFVCTGNTCRSPLAEAVARREVEERGWQNRVRVVSAGTGALPGMPASQGSLTVASRHGLALDDHRSSVLTPELAWEADLVLGMSPGHVSRIREVAPGARVELLGSFARGDGDLAGPAVPDPIGAPVEVYEETYQVIEVFVKQVMERLDETLKAR